MSLAALAVEKKTLTYFVTTMLVLGGLFSFTQLGQLEDPEFAVKTAAITTTYPGASAEEVELEVTDRIELAIQEMPELDRIYSISRPGLSMIKVDIKEEYWADRLPQVWDVLRKKVHDMSSQLPPGADTPQVADDFGDVFGFVLAVTGDGFTYTELEKYAKDLRKELSLVEGVARVDLWGVQDKAIYIDVSETQLAALGLTMETIEATLRQQNMVVDAGQVDVQSERFRMTPTGEFSSPKDIGNLNIRASGLDQLVNLAGADTPNGSATALHTDELIRIRDIGTVRRGYVEPPQWEMRYNGQPALGIYLTNVSNVNVVDMGQAVDKRLRELIGELPVGLEVHRVAWQSDLVSTSINEFMINLIEAVLIVLAVLWVAMGWRMAVIIGVCGLLFTVIGTFLFMAIWDIDLQRTSLGALIIAMGMMVDNAIVVADGIFVRLRQRMERTRAAIEAATQPSMPLLGATIVAVMAFYPIYASSNSTGEYCQSLFQVVAISLLLSWVLSVTVTPLVCLAMLPDPRGQGESEDVYDGPLYQRFRSLLHTAIRWRWGFIGVLVGLLVASGYGFGFVEKTFFPNANRKQFMVDYWAPEGTRIQQVSAGLRPIEAKLLQDPRVKSVSAFMGMGPPRFYLPLDPELPYQSYAQLIVNTETLADVHALVRELEPWVRDNVPEALIRVRKYDVGPSDTWKIEARFSGPAVADPAVLRNLAAQGVAILEASPWAKHVRTDWRERVKKVVLDYDQERARWAAVSRDDIANATKRAFDGLRVGLYREQDDLTPILLRHSEDERQQAAAGLDTLQVLPAFSDRPVPLSQVTDSIAVAWEDPIVWRWDRRRAITVQATPHNTTADALRNRILADFEAIELPPGYRLEWDGEYDSMTTAQEGLKPGLAPAIGLMAVIVVALFNAFRPPLIIACTLPFAIIGITIGLLATGNSFSFMALLGAMSLAGMMIKNAIVLLDQINLDLAAGKPPYQAVIDSAVSRLRPVILAAGTTALGVIPLLQDIFWVSMAMTIMAGLIFGTLLTMVVIPVLYVIFFRVPLPQRA